MKEEEVSMLRVSNIKLNIDDNKSKIKSSLLKKLKIKETDLIKYFIYKESVDARKKGKIDFVYTVDVVVKNEDKLIKKKLKDVVEIKQREYVAQKVLRAAVDELAVNGDVVIVERCAAGAAGFIVCHYFSFTGFAMNTMVSCGSTCAT